MRINTGHNGIAVEQEEEKQKDAADKKAEGIFYITAQFFNTQFPQRRVKETAAASDTSKPILPLRMMAMGLATMTRPMILKTRVMAFLRVKAS